MPKSINTPSHSVENHVIIQDNSLFELNITKTYAGQIDIKTASPTNSIERYDMFEDQHTGIFAEPSAQRLLTVTKIEGVSFQAGASVDPSESRTDQEVIQNNQFRGFTPVMSRNLESSDFPIMNFQVLPPNGRSMYAIIDWINNRFSSLWILISLVDTNGKTRLFRAPIPNSHPEGNICTGSLRFKDFSVQNIKKVIKDAITGGFNADLTINYDQYGYFDQKNSSSPICRLVWKKPMHTIEPELQNNRNNPMLESMQSCVTLLELGENKKIALPIHDHAIDRPEQQNGQGPTNGDRIVAPVQEDNPTFTEGPEPVVTLPEGYDR